MTKRLCALSEAITTVLPYFSPERQTAHKPTPAAHPAWHYLQRCMYSYLNNLNFFVFQISLKHMKLNTAFLSILENKSYCLGQTTPWMDFHTTIQREAFLAGTSSSKKVFPPYHHHLRNFPLSCLAEGTRSPLYEQVWAKICPSFILRGGETEGMEEPKQETRGIWLA